MEGKSSNRAPRQTEGFACVRGASRRAPRHSEPAWSPAGQTNFSYHLHFCRCDEQGAGKLPHPQASGHPQPDGVMPSCFSSSGFHGLVTSCGHCASSPALTCSCPGSKSIEEEEDKELRDADGQCLSLMREALRWIVWFN